jgi:tRNA-splicing ligase RtcB
MPDVHWGIGATVGSVIPTRGAIIPAAVGVDIGCGMMAVQTSLHANHLPDNLHGTRTAIEKAVPHGRTDNGRANDRGAWSDAPAHHAEVWTKMEPAYKAIVEKYPKLDHKQRVNHLGTLGTGNHLSRCVSMKTRTCGSSCTRDHEALAIASARFSSSWQRTTCASG